SRRLWRIISCPAADGMRCVNPSIATLSPSRTFAAIASVRLSHSAIRTSECWALLLESPYLYKMCDNRPSQDDKRCQSPNVIPPTTLPTTAANLLAIPATQISSSPSLVDLES